MPLRVAVQMDPMDKITSARTIYQGWFNVIMLKLKLATGEEIEREIVEHPSGSAVLPYDPERRVALVLRETRPPVLREGEEQMIEVIGGALEEGSAEECARREALEEAGLKLGELTHIAHVWATPASSTERVDYFLGEYRQADRVGPGGGLPEEEEHVRVKEVPLAELWRMVEAHEIRDAKTLALIQALRIARPDLFG